MLLVVSLVGLVRFPVEWDGASWTIDAANRVAHPTARLFGFRRPLALPLLSVSGSLIFRLSLAESIAPSAP